MLKRNEDDIKEDSRRLPIGCVNDLLSSYWLRHVPTEPATEVVQTRICLHFLKCANMNVEKIHVKDENHYKVLYSVYRRLGRLS